MKKYLACLIAFIILGILMYKQVNSATQANLVSRNISFAVYKSYSYKSNVYNNTSAQVQIVVKKINTKGQYMIVWEKNMDAKSLNKYPTPENALTQNVTINNVNRKKEYLLVDYTLTYKSKDAELKMHDATIVKDNMTGKISISI